MTNRLKPWDAVPHPATLLLLRNFATQNGYAAASIFAVPKRLDLNFDKIFIFCNGRRVWETKCFPNGIRRTSGQNFATQNGFAALFLRVPLCPFEEKTEFQGF